MQHGVAIKKNIYIQINQYNCLKILKTVANLVGSIKPEKASKPINRNPQIKKL